MAKFAVAYASLFDNTIDISLIDGESDIEVLSRFLDGHDFGPIPDDYTVEQLIELAFNCDSLVAIRELP